MVVIGLQLNYLAQQALHFIQSAGFFGHHGLFINQVHIAGDRVDGVGEHLVGFRVQLVVAQQLGFGHGFAAEVASFFVGQGTQQGAGFSQVALVG